MNQLIQNAINGTLSFEKQFHVCDGRHLANLQEFLNSLDSMSDGIFRYHVNEQKNDFFNWIEGVFLLSELAEKIKTAKTQKDAKKILNEYFEEIKIQEKLEKDKLDENEKLKILEMKKKEQNNNANNNSNAGYKQFTEEELEWFIKYGKRERHIEDKDFLLPLQAKVEEFKAQLSELRKEEKDTLIADLLMKPLNAKIEYFKHTKNTEDFSKIVSLMEEVKEEIADCRKQIKIDVKKEILERATLTS